MAKVAFHTLGCKVNHYESEAMMDLFKKKGYDIVDFNEEADVYVVNSCTVTNEAARKSRQLARKARRINPEAIVALVGCYTQVAPDEVKGIEGVDLFLGTSNRSHIVEYVEEFQKLGSANIEILKRQDLSVFEDLRVESLQETTRAYVKIEEGCNQFCSYCIIPYARGPVRSREPESVREEIKELVDKGVKEIILTGTHLGAYGTDWGKEDSLEQLLQELVKIDGLEHIRLSSIEVTEITEGLIDILATEQKVCPHLHLPLQSGSDKILKLMRRPYSTAEFRAMVEKLRERIKDIAITTDVIVGFPGEDEEAFQENYNFVKEMAFSRLHVFPFSKREGTPAARMGEQVSAEQKKIYSNKMLALNEELMLEYQSRFLGTVRPVIVEEKRDQETKLLTGMTDNYLRVLVDADETYMGQLVKVKLLKSHSHETVIGEIV
ncbi:MAG TPA: tRNA (N(6)-L-threonylcarbamoyladenosine(37)-C(2))-methylthiotransferase MtaB [Halanaerobiaceae bacterium]|jgi:threonylcarbamoyladenosine tRNA methylthiotransferase MtaB|nr:tRNA (N(6)-L-threonylcarbamoyladenosine(37)-C(2))-methylthiotransferase MtaB [Bacillota bacterium]HHU92001.1 tRNA (N(6)-L-threonylcarbamoyladenosine(37)-C(2))-methylthiotransferase MtaB [Halanaerobiaceae bacterium]HOA40821.1 tRNA (N(6)-L-threonylcarbamoyladenosine(37)-C(2))-methylthiotransferase MtaB [Halanaerobiales bacterium]HPZ62930.1 tRNA (N(6)-L-threonylcarbamoyladenosine(37)-C(2))-methylthiotransferase MtaB [Halanaerobiales bacterium]HQD04165.1 tRNA (N(6)-L-threonylcarbamoyladenosine(3